MEEETKRDLKQFLIGIGIVYGMFYLISIFLVGFKIATIMYGFILSLGVFFGLFYWKCMYPLVVYLTNKIEGSKLIKKIK